LLRDRTHGQAQTGTGKTAAFALPLLSMLDVARREPQVLVLVPTRELAIQVAEAFQKYEPLPGLHVLPVYGGRATALKRCCGAERTSSWGRSGA
jgi:ATP-dependent RNA helicase DeaD